MKKDNNNKNKDKKKNKEHKEKQTKKENIKEKINKKTYEKTNKKENKEKEQKLESITMYELKSKLPKDGNLTMYRKEEFEEENDPDFLEIINEILYGEEDDDYWAEDDYYDMQEDDEDMDEDYDIFDRIIAEEEEERKELKPKLRKICKKGIEEYTAKGERGAEFLELYEKLKKNIRNIDEKYELFMELEKMGNPEFALSVVLQYIGYSKKQILDFDFLTDIYEYLTGTGGF